MFPTAVTTFESLPIPIGFFGFGMDVVTSRTSLGSVSWWNKNHLNSSNQSFIQNLHSELIERPIVCLASFGFASRFFVEGLPNVGQILKSQRCIKLFCFSYKLFGYIVEEKPTRPATAVVFPSTACFTGFQSRGIL